MYNRILVPLDGSSLSEAAIPHARELAKRFGAELVLLQATTSLAQVLTQTAAGMEPTPAGPDLTVRLAEETVTAEADEAKEYLTRTGAVLEAEGIRVQREVVEGNAGQVLLDYATQHQIDLIVMSSHGRGGLGRLVYGSVADEVIRHGHVPVLLVRPVLT